MNNQFHPQIIYAVCGWSHLSSNISHPPLEPAVKWSHGYALLERNRGHPLSETTTHMQLTMNYHIQIILIIDLIVIALVCSQLRKCLKLIVIAMTIWGSTVRVLWHTKPRRQNKRQEKRMNYRLPFPLCCCMTLARSRLVDPTIEFIKVWLLCTMNWILLLGVTSLNRGGRGREQTLGVKMVRTILSSIIHSNSTVT